MSSKPLSQLQVGEKVFSLDFELVATVSAVKESSFVLDFPEDVASHSDAAWMRSGLKDNQVEYPFTSDAGAFELA